VVYDAPNALSLDVYRAQGARGPAPVVLFFYGGTWSEGEREYYRFVGESLSSHGAAVLATDPRYLARWQLRPRDFASVIGLSGPYDFLPIRERKVQRVFPDQSR